MLKLSQKNMACFTSLALKSWNFAQILENFAQSCDFKTSTFRSSAPASPGPLNIWFFCLKKRNSLVFFRLVFANWNTNTNIRYTLTNKGEEILSGGSPPLELERLGDWQPIWRRGVLIFWRPNRVTHTRKSSSLYAIGLLFCQVYKGSTYSIFHVVLFPHVL